METRHRKILSLLSEHGRLPVSDIAEAVAVSQVTVRKDLQMLAQAGFLRREHGNAYLSPGEDMGSRLAYHYENKLAIARRAAACVQPGDTVMIESGSCCTLLAEHIAKHIDGVTIITNSAFIADRVQRDSGARVVLLGGEYQRASQVLVGPLTAHGAALYRASQLFIGIDGFVDHSFMGRDLMRAEAVRAMAKQSARVCVLTESETFEKQGTVSLLPGKAVHAVYTDDNVSAHAAHTLEGLGIDIIRRDIV